MNTEHPIHELIHEHHYILKVVHGLSLFDAALERGERVDTELLRCAVEFMREFADRCHHAKEEKILFPAMIRKGVPETGCPLEGLLREHARGRELVAALAQANAAHAAGDAGALRAQNQELLTRNKMLQSEIDVLHATKEELQSNDIQRWFVFGGLLVALGALLGTILPLLKPKRRRYSEWS